MSSTKKKPLTPGNIYQKKKRGKATGKIVVSEKSRQQEKVKEE